MGLLAQNLILMFPLKYQLLIVIVHQHREGNCNATAFYTKANGYNRTPVTRHTRIDPYSLRCISSNAVFALFERDHHPDDAIA